MAAENTGLIIGPALLLGAVIGAYEFLIIQRDVQVAAQRFGHGIHAFLLSIAFVFAAMNVEFVLDLLPFLQNIPLIGTALGAQVLVGLIAALKIHAVSRATVRQATRGRTAETWFHSFLVGALIAASPYAYHLIEPVVPSWLTF